MTTDEILGIARAFLAAVGGYAVARGLIDQATMVTLSGALATLIVGVWSVVSKRK